MFPTLSYIIKYLTGKWVHFELPTFGFFMVVSFCLSYWVFSIEFKRKENLGIIFPFTQTRFSGSRINYGKVFLFNIAALLIGYKLGYYLINFRQIPYNSQFSIFSSQGNPVTAIVGILIADVLYYLNIRKIKAEKAAKIIITVHPYQLMDQLLFWCGLIGFAGAILFSKFEKFDWLSKSDLPNFFAYNGLTFYGGLIFGAITYLFILRSKGIALHHAADIGSPGMMLAYGVGRIGCHLSGDGDWGIVNLAPKPFFLHFLPDWIWSFKFPHNVIYQGSYIPGCTGPYCNELMYPVFPTSFYESVICLLLFFLLWILRPKITIPGLMFSIFAILNGAERFLMESIRINPKFVWGAYQFSQAELLSAVIFFMGVIGVFWSVAAYEHSKKFQKNSFMENKVNNPPTSKLKK